MNRKLYDISADGGKSWTQQWLTEAEAEKERQHFLVCLHK